MLQKVVNFFGISKADIAMQKSKNVFVYPPSSCTPSLDKADSRPGILNSNAINTGSTHTLPSQSFSVRTHNIKH
jgi:hypothetical protein